MLELYQPLKQIIVTLGTLIFHLITTWGLLIVWVVWWLLAVNWKKVWPVLAQGAWVPAVLIMFVSALVWSQIYPSACNCLGFMSVPNFWWQLGEVGLLAGIALFCGWLQGYFGWTPEDVTFDPASVAADHGHGHDAHGHHQGHGHQDHGHHDHGHEAHGHH